MKKILIMIFVFFLFSGCGENSEKTDNDETNGIDDSDSTYLNDHDNDSYNETNDYDETGEYKCLHHCWMSPYKNPYTINSRYRETGYDVEVVVVDTHTNLEWASLSINNNPEYNEEKCKGLTFNGKSDWRAADEYELESIKLYHHYYYDSRIYIENTPYNVNLFKIPSNVIECVRGEDNTYGEEPNRYLRKTVEGETIVLDQKTELTWTGKIFGDSSSISNSCGDLVYGGHDNWRFPDIYQLRTLISYEDESLKTYFPGIKGETITSSTYITRGDMNYYYSIDFSTGEIEEFEINSETLNICVLDGD